jgi:Uma2 family endonuclease
VYYRAGRLDAAHLPSGHLTLVPDLVAEVISPRDIAEEVESKVREYLRAGVPVIWLVYPEARTVHVIRPGGRATLLDDAGTLTGEEILPGFETPVSKLFPAG